VNHGYSLRCRVNWFTLFDCSWWQYVYTIRIYSIYIRNTYIYIRYILRIYLIYIYMYIVYIRIYLYIVYNVYIRMFLLLFVLFSLYIVYIMLSTLFFHSSYFFGIDSYFKILILSDEDVIVYVFVMYASGHCDKECGQSKVIPCVWSILHLDFKKLSGECGWNYVVG